MRGANVLRDLKKNEEALSCFDRALTFNPRYVRALNNRGNVLNDLGRSDEAIASYDRALEIDPDYKDALMNRGNALFGVEAFCRGVAEL
jgi:tetratricopeptide (TPR) repeat protein